MALPGVAELRQKALAEMAVLEVAVVVVVALETGLVALEILQPNLPLKVVMAALEKMSIGMPEAVVAAQLR